jgi:3-oxoacyl-[acyl-carrier-protein] synthase II
MAKARPVLLAWDGVSSMGIDWQIAWRRAVAGESGIGPLTRFPLRPDSPVRTALPASA